MAAKEEKPADVKEEPVEPEKDAPSDKRARFGGPLVSFNVEDSTLNCALGGPDEAQIITPIMGETFALLAAARTTVGVKAGRYYLEADMPFKASQTPSVLIGFSPITSSILLNKENGIAFRSDGAVLTGGEVSTAHKGAVITRGDVFGVLLNRDPKATTANTVSLFVNGKRASEPIPLPAFALKDALFPHLSVQNATARVNFSKSPWKPLPFTVRLLADIAKHDAIASPHVAVATPQLVVPFGKETAALVAKLQAEKAAENYLAITHPFVQSWQEASGARGFGRLELLALQKRLAERKRNVIYAMGAQDLIETDRHDFGEIFAKWVSKKYIVNAEVVKNLPTTMALYNDVTLPTHDEGFEVTFEPDVTATTDALAEWKRAAKLQTKVPDLKPGVWFKEQYEAWIKGKAERKKEATKKKVEDKEEKKEEKEEEKSSLDLSSWSDEDWFLAEFRTEMHLIVHAFVEDVEDKERVSFAVEHYPHYYRLYTNKQFNPRSMNCPTVEDTVKLIADCMTVENGLLQPKLDKNITFDQIYELTEKARDIRDLCVNAGDELSALQFSMKHPSRIPLVGPNGAKGKGKGFQSRGAPAAQGPVGAQLKRIMAQEGQNMPKRIRA